MADAMIWVCKDTNGPYTPLPWPKRGLSLDVMTIVDFARNANGVVVGQKIGRDQQKLNSMEWPYLTAAQWKTVLQLFRPGFYVYVKYISPETNGLTTRKMYPGDRSAEPWMMDVNGTKVTDPDHPEISIVKPLYYINCKVNIIDVGKN